MLESHFEFPDGDSYPMHISKTSAGEIRLSDRGHTLMHMSYDVDVDSCMKGTRGELLDRIVKESGIRFEDGEFCLETPEAGLPEAVFRFGQALTRIFDLTLHSRSNVSSTFYEDLQEIIMPIVGGAKIQKDYCPDVPNSDLYRVDYMIPAERGRPLFLYGVPNRDKAMRTTIILSHFHRHSLEFESIIVFADQAAIPSGDIARLSDVGGEMVSSLESNRDLTRKVRQRLAA